MSQKWHLLPHALNLIYSGHRNQPCTIEWGAHEVSTACMKSYPWIGMVVSLEPTRQHRIVILRKPLQVYLWTVHTTTASCDLSLWLIPKNICCHMCKGIHICQPYHRRGIGNQEHNFWGLLTIYCQNEDNQEVSILQGIPYHIRLCQSKRKACYKEALMSSKLTPCNVILD